MDITSPDGNDGVPGTIHSGEAQPEIEQNNLSVPPMERVGESSECNIE